MTRKHTRGLAERVLTALLALCCWTSADSLAQIKFGATLTLTGSAAPWGKNTRLGMELAREELNKSGGIQGQQLEILYEDIGETDLKRAVSAAQKFISVDKVNALLPMITEDSEVIWPIAHKRNLLTMAIYAGGKDLTKDKPLFFQVSSSDEVLCRTIADYALSTGVRSACLLVERGAYATPLGEFTKAYLHTHGIPAPVLEEYDPSVSEFKSLLLRLRTSGCGSFFFFTSPNRQGAVLRQMQQLQWNPLKLGLDTSEDSNTLQIAGKGTEGLIYAKYFLATPQFKQAFKARFGREAGVPASLAYDAVMLLGRSMREHGTESQALSRALLALRDYPGASGPITFGADGTRENRVAELWEIRDGRPGRINEAAGVKKSGAIEDRDSPESLR